MIYIKKNVLNSLITIILILFEVSIIGAIIYGNHYKPKIIYIDPGHGGYDSGALSYDKSMLEKDIVLKLSLLIQENLEFYGYKVILTRIGDEAVKNNKHDDIISRVKMINSSSADVYISIHANSYPITKIKGAQVFYKDNEENKNIAKIIQKNIKLIDKNNLRQAQEIKGKYLIDHVNIPGCLIEIGFLSNQEDLNNLRSDKYLGELAQIITISLIGVLK